MGNKPKQLSTESKDALLAILEARFSKNIVKNLNISWKKLHSKLQSSSEKLAILHEMEETGGEPNVVAYDKNNDEYTFFDCVAESPKGRRSTCYDQEALDERKEAKPANSAIEMAKQIGITILDEEQYRYLQQLGDFDLKTSSWLETPAEIRKLGGAIFGDKRYNTVFIYHNGAQSYYAARGFRGCLKV